MSAITVFESCGGEQFHPFLSLSLSLFHFLFRARTLVTHHSRVHPHQCICHVAVSSCRPRRNIFFFLSSQQRNTRFRGFQKRYAHILSEPPFLCLSLDYIAFGSAQHLCITCVDTRISSLFVFSVFIAQSIRVRRDAHAFSFSLSRFRSLKGKERRGSKEGVLRSGRVATYKSNQRSGSVCLFQFVMSLSVYVSVCCRGFRASYITVVSSGL